MKIEKREFQDTVEGIAKAIISTQSLSDMENDERRRRVVEASIRISKEIYSQVNRVSNTDDGSVAIGSAGNLKTSGRTIS